MVALGIAERLELLRLTADREELEEREEMAFDLLWLLVDLLTLAELFFDEDLLATCELLPLLLFASRDDLEL